MASTKKTAPLTSIEHDGTTYELGMTRKGIRLAEEQGLSTTEMQAKPFSAIGYLFFASLYNRYRLPLNKAVGILDDALDAGTVDFTALFEALIGEYNELFGSGGSGS